MYFYSLVRAKNGFMSQNLENIDFLLDINILKSNINMAIADM